MRSFVEDFLSSRDARLRDAWAFKDSKSPFLAQISPDRPRRPQSGDIVMGTGKGEARTLGEAVERVAAGGRIFVKEGVYRHDRGIVTKKPFELVGEGARRSVLKFRWQENCLELCGRSTWRLRGVAIILDLGKTKKTTKGGQLLQGDKGARVEAEECLFAGAQAKVGKDGSFSGGEGAMAFRGAKMHLYKCHLAFNYVGASSHGAPSELTMERCVVYGCELGGLITADTGRARAVNTHFSANQHDVFVLHDGGEINVEKCDLHDAMLTAAYAPCGTLVLRQCTITAAGGHGVGIEGQAKLVAENCMVRANNECGLWLQGKASVTGCKFVENEEHGVLLLDGSKGSIRNSRFIENEQYGLVRDPRSKVQTDTLRFKGNGNGDEYVYGTLEKEIQRGLPKGLKIPAKLAALARYQEEHGRMINEALRLDSGPLYGWPGHESTFAVFGHVPDGSVIAFWLQAGKNIAGMPVVYIDSENNEHKVLGKSIDEFLSILALGHDELKYPELEPQVEAENELEEFQTWLRDELAIKPARNVKKIIADAEKLYPGLNSLLTHDLSKT